MDVRDPDLWVSLWALIYYARSKPLCHHNFLVGSLGPNNVGVHIPFWLVSWNRSHSVSGLRGAAYFCALKFKICWLHGLLPLTSEGTLRDNFAPCKETVSLWRIFHSIFSMSPNTNGQFCPYIGIYAQEFWERRENIVSLNTGISKYRIENSISDTQPIYWTYIRKGTVFQYIQVTRCIAKPCVPMRIRNHHWFWCFLHSTS